MPSHGVSERRDERPTSFSVVIPTLNEERHVGFLLSDMEKQTRYPDEVLVADAGSTDATLEVVGRFPAVRVLGTEPPVAVGRNRGGYAASGDVILFLDADVRLRPTFFERFLAEFRGRNLDVACPMYYPHDSTRALEVFHAGFNALIRLFERTLPSGAGHCIAVRKAAFRESRGFDPRLKFDDIELIRRLSRGRAFGIVREKVFVSDRRYREHGTARMILQHLLLATFFAIGRFEWANRIDYEFGKHRY